MDILKIIFGAVFVNNLVLMTQPGINEVLLLAEDKDNKKAVHIGLVGMLILVISTFVTKLIYDNLLAGSDFEYTQAIVYVVVIVLIGELCYTLFKNSLKEKYKSLEEVKKVLLVNNLFLGVSLIVAERGLTLVDTLAYSVGVSLGVILVSYLLASINYKYRFVNMPEAFKGRPISIMALGLIALAFYGFAGLV